MSGYVRPALITAIAESIGISDLSEEVSRVLAPDVEYRVRDILQARDMEQIYGLNSEDRRRYSKIAGASDAFQIEDTLLRCQDVIHTPLPPPPLQIMEANAVEVKTTAVAADSQSNDTNFAKNVPSAANAPGAGTAVIAALDKSGTPAVLMPIIKHSITEELSELLRICAKVLLTPTEEVGPEHPVFATLATDAGLDAAVPYIVTMIARGARENPQDLPRLWRLLWAANCLIRNQTNNAAAYLSQLLPALLTLLLNNSLGLPGSFDHLRLRRHAAHVLGDVADRYHQPDLNMRARIATTCIKALRKQPMRLCTCYGALQGLQALGGRTLRLVLLPELGDVHNALLPSLTQGEASMQEAGDRRSALTLAQAEHCVGALRDSACAACRQGAKEVAAAGLSAAVMARLSGLDDAARSGAWNSPGTRHAAAAIDTRIEELEAQAQKALQEGRKLHEQRLQQVQALQRVEAAAKASLEGGDSGRTTRRPSSDGAGPSGEAVDPAAAARAAARIAAESFDPDRAGGTALRDTGTGSNATAANAEAGGDEVMDSPPGSPIFVPPPPKSPPTAPANAPSATDGKAAPDAQLQPQQNLSQGPVSRDSAPGSSKDAPQDAATSQGDSTGPGSMPATNGLQPSSAVAEQGSDTPQNTHPQGQDRAQNGNSSGAHSSGQEGTGSEAQNVAASDRCTEAGAGKPEKAQKDTSGGNQGASPKTDAAVPSNGEVRKGIDPKNSSQIIKAGRPGTKSKQVSASQPEMASPRMQQALKEGHHLGRHISVVCELYGEAVLPWLGLDRVGGVFL